MQTKTNLAAMQNSFKVTRWHLRALQPEKLSGRCMPLDVSMPSIATCPLHEFNLPTKKILIILAESLIAINTSREL